MIVFWTNLTHISLYLWKMLTKDHWFIVWNYNETYNIATLLFNFAH